MFNRKKVLATKIAKIQTENMFRQKQYIVANIAKKSYRKYVPLGTTLLVAKRNITKTFCPVGTTHPSLLFTFLLKIIKIRIIFGNQAIVNRENSTNWQFKF